MVWALVIALLAGSPDELAEGLRLFSEMQYEAAQPLLAGAKLDTARSDEERASAALHLAIIQLTLGDEESVQRNLGEAVALHRGIEPPAGASPRIAELLAAAKAALPAPVPERLSLRHVPPPAGNSRPLIEITLVPESFTPTPEVVVRYRFDAAGPWAAVAALGTQRPGVLRAAPVAPEGALTMEYYIEALGADDAVLVALGSAQAPVRLQLVTPTAQAPLPEEDPIYTRWWFWTIGGAVVAGGVAIAIAAVVLNSGAKCHAPSGQGCVTFQVR